MRRKRVVLAAVAALSFGVGGMFVAGDGSDDVAVAVGSGDDDSTSTTVGRFRARSTETTTTSTTTEPDGSTTTTAGPTTVASRDDSATAVDDSTPGTTGSDAPTPPAPTSTTTTTRPAPVRIAASPSPYAPFHDLEVRSVDPCPVGTSEVWVLVRLLSDGWTFIAAEDRAPVGADGSWRVKFLVYAVSDEEPAISEHSAAGRGLELYAYCDPPPNEGNAHLVDNFEPTYPMVPLDIARLPEPPSLSAEYDSATRWVTAHYGGCPGAIYGHVSWHETSPIGDTSQMKGAYPKKTSTYEGSATFTVPADFNPSVHGLWAGGACTEASGVTSVYEWAFVELVPPPHRR